MFSNDELQLIAEMVVAGGKNIQSGPEGIIKAAQCLQIIQRIFNELNSTKEVEKE